MVADSGQGLRQGSDSRPPRHRPLIPILCGLALGIAADGWLQPAWWIWLGAGATAAAALAGCLVFPAPRWANWVAAALVAAVPGGALHAVRARHKPPRHLARLNLQEDRLYRLEGRVTEGPRAYFRKIPFAEPEAPPSRFWTVRVELEALSGASGSRRPAAGGLVVFVNAGPPAVGWGDMVRFVARLRKNRPPTNPGERNMARVYARTGSHGTASLPGPAVMRVVQPAPWYSPRAAVARARRRLDRRLRRHLPPGKGGLVRALLFGRRNALAPRRQRLLKETGTLHFLAISGLHVGIFCLFAGWVLRWSGVEVRLRYGLTIALIWLYVLFTGAHVSAMRAGWMLSLVLAAPLLGRRRDTMSALAGAAVALLVLWPQQLFSPGFQLTFLAAWAVLVIYPQLAGIFWPWGEFLGSVQAPEERGLLSETWLYARSYLLLSATVWLATAPVRAYHFHTLSLAAPVLNLLLWPLVLVLLITCFALVPALLLFGPLAGLLASVASYLSGDIQVLLEAANAVPGLPLYVPAPPLWWVALFYVALSLWVLRWRLRWGAVSFVAVAVALSLTWIWHDAAVRLGQDFRVTMADVGHGQAVLAEVPRGQAVLFDAGSTRAGRAGAVAGLLWRARRRKLHAVVLSHMNEDHVNFLPHLQQRFELGIVLTADRWPRTPLGRSISQWLQRPGVREEDSVLEGSRLRTGKLVCEVLHPGLRFARRAKSPNERSLVLKCRYGKFTWLVCGDIEKGAMRRLNEDYGERLRADVLFMPHHGHFHPGLGEFLDHVRPRAALISAGEARVEHDTERLLSERGIPVWLTGRDGATMVTFADGVVRIEAWKSGRSMTFRPTARKEER